MLWFFNNGKYKNYLFLGPDSTKDSSIRGYKEPVRECKCSAIPSKDRGFATDLTLLELENRELRMKIRRLEKELADKVSEP